MPFALTDLQDSHTKLDEAAKEAEEYGVGWVFSDDWVTELRCQKRHDGRRSKGDVLRRSKDHIDEAAHERRI